MPNWRGSLSPSCHTLYLYDTPDDHAQDAEPPADDAQPDLFATPGKEPRASADAPSGLTRRDGITDAGLAHFQQAYPGEDITKEAIFYYVYGILHSPEYRERYADNLGKELPRIPRMKKAETFWAFSRAGRELADLHVGYESAPEYAATVELPKDRPPDVQLYRVEKMRFGRVKPKGGKAMKDRTTIRYNDLVTVRGIPLEAYDYVVNGKPAIEWVMERQAIKTDKASGIVKDPNLWATETIGDPRHPLSLLLRVTTISLETRRITNSLPNLDIHDDG